MKNCDHLDIFSSHRKFHFQSFTSIAKRCPLAQFPQNFTDPSRPPMTSSDPTYSLDPLMTPNTQKDLMMMGIKSATFTSPVCLLCANFLNFNQLHHSNRLKGKVATTLGLIFYLWRATE